MSQPPQTGEGSKEQPEERECPQQASSNGAVGGPQRTDNCTPEPEKPKRFWRDYAPIDKFNFFLMIFTALLVLIGGSQVLSFMESERAFVITEGTISTSAPELIAEKKQVFVLAFKDVGRHPAQVTSMVVVPAWIIYKAGVPTSLPKVPKYLPTFQIPLRTIAPDDHWREVMQISCTDCTPADDANFNSGKSRFYIYGILRYATGYWFPFFVPSEGRVGFCFEYVPPKEREFSEGNVFTTCNAPAYIFST